MTRIWNPYQAIGFRDCGNRQGRLHTWWSPVCATEIPLECLNQGVRNILLLRKVLRRAIAFLIIMMWMEKKKLVIGSGLPVISVSRCQIVQKNNSEESRRHQITLKSIFLKHQHGIYGIWVEQVYQNFTIKLNNQHCLLLQFR